MGHEHRSQAGIWYALLIDALGHILTSKLNLIIVLSIVTIKAGLAEEGKAETETRT